MDERHRELGEGGAAVRVEARHGLDRAHDRDLLQVVEPLGAARVAAGNPAGERQQPKDQLITTGETTAPPFMAVRSLPRSSPLKSTFASSN